MKYITILSTVLFVQIISASLFDFVAPPNERNPDKCEDYENEYYGEDSYLNCDISCQVMGNIGMLQIRRPSRKLRIPKYDGAYCLIKISVTRKEGSNSGIDFYRQGSCYKGVCQETQSIPFPGPIPVDINGGIGDGAVVPAGGAIAPATDAFTSGGVSSSSMPIYCPPIPYKK